MQTDKYIPVVKKLADTILVELDPAYKKLKVGFGESFYYRDGKLWLNGTPFGDPSLVTMRKLSSKDGELTFERRLKGIWQSYSVKPVFVGSEVVIDLIIKLDRTNLLLENGFNDEIYMLVDADGFTLRLNNTQANKRMLLTISNQYGNTLLQRFPEPSIRRPVHSVEMVENILVIQCASGEEDSGLMPSKSDLVYNWELDLQHEIRSSITKLISSLVSSYSL